MDSVEVSKGLTDRGRFAEAFVMLERSTVPDAVLAKQILRTELMERIGRFGQATVAATRLLRSERLTSADRSACEFVIGKIDLEAGAIGSAQAHFQRAVYLAAQGQDLNRKCWPHLWLLVLVADRSGPNAALPIIAELRSDAIKLGERNILAALHMNAAQMEAKRGLLTNAKRHVRLGQDIMAGASNLWIEALLHITKANIALMTSDYESAKADGRRAVDIAEQSGGAAALRTCLANYAYVLYLTGQFDDAIRYIDRAISVVPSTGESHSALLDTIAQIHLAKGEILQCSQLLDTLEAAIHSPEDRVLYGYRHSALTRAQLLSRTSVHEAISRVDHLLVTAAEANDSLLMNSARLLKAHLLHRSGSRSESRTLLEAFGLTLYGQAPAFYAQYETVLACCSLADANNKGAATAHKIRAEGILRTLGHVPGLLELTRSWEAALDGAPSTADESSPAFNDSATIAGNAIQTVAAVLLQASRPELVARGVVDLLDQSGCARHVTAIVGDRDAQHDVIATCGEQSDDGSSPPRRLAIGSVRDQPVDVWVAPKDDIESIATLNAVRVVLATVHDLERARAEREERLTLWPIEDVPLNEGHAVVNGRMRELMAFAKRVATTNVSVLITGESGTGKEILARAIHTYSERASKPFLAFNCAAIPREMLESQLFGYRRGAFTGADRDNPGLIRSARDGTLFLDEIGELSLDLQPKLLRFLESGEISPLGEAASTVDVRIIAATNARLEDAVKAGRFREDLFYRLNVIRLAIPPLRERRDEIPALVHHFVMTAAAEFKKNVRVGENTMEQLLLYDWPGNIRQLHNELRRMIALAPADSVLEPEALSPEIANARPPLATGHGEIAVPLHEKLQPTLARIEREMIKVALREHHGKVEEVAKALGISRKGLYLKRQRLGL